MGAAVGIGERNLLIGRGQNQLLDSRQLRHFGLEFLFVTHLLQRDDFRWILPVGGVELCQIAGHALLQLLPRALDGWSTDERGTLGHGLEFYVRKLAKHGVRLVSITQELGDDLAQVMMRQVIALFDEYQSKENAKHVLRAMKENARQGFWNGSCPPLGYRTVEAERRGARVKKRLAVDPVEAEQVRLIFKLFLEGQQGSGPMGIKAIATWLNERGYTTRIGGRWGTSRVHSLLSNPVYAGRQRFNIKDPRTCRLKGASEHIYCDALAIVGSETFDRVQALLKSRNPRVSPPRVVTSPILLTGLAVCASCGGSMTLRAGTSRSGEVYRYYSCSSFLKKGRPAEGGPCAWTSSTSWSRSTWPTGSWSPSG
jgi:DNA invertase Pin-like site-specific DNA recombinase